MTNLWQTAKKTDLVALSLMSVPEHPNRGMDEGIVKFVFGSGAEVLWCEGGNAHRAHSSILMYPM